MMDMFHNTITLALNIGPPPNKKYEYHKILVPLAWKFVANGARGCTNKKD